MLGEYYLHENGRLIYKPSGGVDPSSPFVKRVWREHSFCDSPQSFANWLATAAKAGANPSDINALAKKNQLEDYIPDWEKQVFQ